jgi:transcriptional regulator with XRE-family HTH domain
MPEPSLFGRRLRLARERRHLTQEELSVKAGVPAVMISHFETGVRQSASADTLVKLADALNVTVDFLLGRSESMELAGKEAAAILRSLKDAPSETIQAARAVVEALAQRSKTRKAREGS